MRNATSLLLLLLALTGLSSRASAQGAPDSAEAERSDPRRAPLRPFTAAQIAILEPLLADSVVSYVGYPRGPELPAVLLAAEIRAPAERVYELLRRPEGYPRIMPAVSEVSVRSRHAEVVGFEWAWQAGMFRMRGENELTVRPPPEGHPERGYRLSLVATGGDLGVGRTIWRVLPRPEGRSLLLMAMRLDLRDSSYLTRQMSSASTSINRSLNMALAFAMVRGIRERAEGGPRGVAVGAAGPSRPRVDLAALDRLLAVGDLVWVTPGVAAGEAAALPQVNLLSRLPYPEERVRRLMGDPVAFAEALIHGSQARVLRSGEEGVRFAWSIDLPILGTGGEMDLRQSPTMIELSAAEGALHGGTWRFATQEIRPRETLVLGWSRFDVADASFLLRAVIDSDPAFRDGLSASTDLMMTRAMRIRLARPLPHPTPRGEASEEGAASALALRRRVRSAQVLRRVPHLRLGLMDRIDRGIPRAPALVTAPAPAAEPSEESSTRGL